MNAYSEENLIIEAKKILGDDEEVLAAGRFSLTNLLAASTVGIAGGIAAGYAAGDILDPTGAGDAIGAVIGRHAAVRTSAEAQGVTPSLLVAVTPDTIHVLNGDTDGRLKTEVAKFSRAHVTCEMTKFGLSRLIKLTDTTTGETIELNGSVSWLAAKSEGDKAVFAVLPFESHK